MNREPFKVIEIEDKVYELLGSFQEFKDNKVKQSEIWEEHRELLEDYAITSLELKLYEDDCPKSNETDKTNRFHELEIKYHGLLSKICTTLKVELPLNLDDSALDDF